MSMSFAIVTPSDASDFEACRLLVDSVDRMVTPAFHHYVVVDRRDLALFSSLRSPRTQVLAKQEILPWFLHQAPWTSNWWINLKGMPVRGWVLQQIIKLSAPSVTEAEGVVLLDSDSFLVKPYEPRTFLREGRLPLFRQLLPDASDWNNNQAHRVAAWALGMPLLDEYRTNYESRLVVWRRENVLRLQEHIQKTTGRFWIDALLAAGMFREYVLYGVFCEHVLKEDSGHFLDATNYGLDYGSAETLDEAGLRALREKLGPEHICVTVSSQSNTPIGPIRQVFELPE